MYSAAWYDTFAATIPERITDAEADAIASIAPPARFPRLIELGCGTGRLAAALAQRGFHVTGIDVNMQALRSATRRVPGAQFVALDQRHVGRMPWEFNVALIVWNSLGFESREADLEMLTGLRGVLHPRGKLLLDLYHPGWLRANERRDGYDDRGAAIRRWIEGGRCHNEIRYADGAVDRIAFNIYSPEEMASLLRSAGLHVERAFSWWDTSLEPSAELARYQLECVRSA